METKLAAHTPGPWTVTQYSSGAEIYARVPLKDGTRGEPFLLVAEVASDRHNDPQGNANAHLIAASPRLLEACKLAVPLLYAALNVAAAHELEAAINAAEGG